MPQLLNDENDQGDGNGDDDTKYFAIKFSKKVKSISRVQSHILNGARKTFAWDQPSSDCQRFSFDGSVFTESGWNWLLLNSFWFS